MGSKLGESAICFIYSYSAVAVEEEEVGLYFSGMGRRVEGSTSLVLVGGTRAVSSSGISRSGMGSRQ